MKFDFLTKYNAHRLNIILVALLVLMGSYIFIEQRNGDFVKGVSFSTIPEDAVFISHPEDEEIVKEKGGAVMRHYATKEDLKNGGPVYGVLGYSVVSVEYEVKISDIKNRPVGDPEQSGIDLTAENLARKKKISFDHFHIGLSKSHSHSMNEVEKEGIDNHTHSHTESYSEIEQKQQEQEVYLIHYMLIPHEREIAYGLTCS